MTPFSFGRILKMILNPFVIRKKPSYSFDDSIIEKPYTKENRINCWHYFHVKGRSVKEINLLTADL